MQLKEAFTEVKKEVVKKVETKPAGPQPGDVWTEPVIGMEFAWIPGGCFQMGQTEKEKQLLRQIAGEEDYKWFITSESPRHRVCVDGFWMAKYEVTNAQYRTWKPNHDSTDYEGHSLNGENQPVLFVSWEEASAFTDWLTDQQQNQYTFRLPTEAEWEYAARAGTTTIWYWGDNPDDACQYENVLDQTAKEAFHDPFPHHECHDSYAVTAPVGSFRPNAFGLYDMAGNVWEWCQDIFRDDAYQNPQHQNPLITSGGSDRVFRGGSWGAPPVVVRSAVRVSFPPTERSPYGGFRLVRTP